MKAIILLAALMVSCAINPEDYNEELVYGGKDAALGQFKYQVRVKIHLDNKMDSLCGGSLVTPDYVITAAHCTWRLKPVTMYFGVIDTKKIKNAVQSKATEIHVHPEYRHVKHQKGLNDISILKTQHPIQMSDHIGTIGLPAYSQSSPTHFDGVYAITSGWGQTGKINKVNTILQWAKVHVAAQKWCQNQLKHHSFTPEKNICTDKTIDTTPCKGDSGGPLIYFQEPTKPILIGIVSWGMGQCHNPFPNAYTRVAGYLQFIHNVTGIKIES